jgi:hypothetical protein
MPAQYMAMAIQRRKYEIAKVDKDWDLTEPPSARSWYALSKACGQKAMYNERELRFAGFPFGPTGPHATYRWHSSVPTNNGPMKVYAHRRNKSHPGNPNNVQPWENCYVMVRFAPTLRVQVLAKPDLAVRTPPHKPHAKIELGQMGHCMPAAAILWSMTFPHEVEDVTLKMILSTAKKYLVENEHVTSSGKVRFYFDGQEVTTKPATVLVKKTRAWRQPACIALFLFVLDCAVTTASRCSSLSHERLQPLHSFIIIIIILLIKSD